MQYTPYIPSIGLQHTVVGSTNPDTYLYEGESDRNTEELDSNYYDSDLDTPNTNVVAATGARHAPPLPHTRLSSVDDPLLSRAASSVTSTIAVGGSAGGGMHSLPLQRTASNTTTQPRHALSSRHTLNGNDSDSDSDNCVILASLQTSHNGSSFEPTATAATLIAANSNTPRHTASYGGASFSSPIATTTITTTTYPIATPQTVVRTQPSALNDSVICLGGYFISSI